MTFDQAKCAIGDLARPLALLASVAAVFYALHLKSPPETIAILVGGAGAMYGAKAVETAVIGHAQAKASGGTQP